MSKALGLRDSVFHLMGLSRRASVESVNPSPRSENVTEQGTHAANSETPASVDVLRNVAIFIMHIQRALSVIYAASQACESTTRHTVAACSMFSFVRYVHD